MEQVKIELTQADSAAVYLRVSKEDGNDVSASIHTQQMMLEAYCHDHGIPIFNIYADDGYSGLNYDRPAFNRMLSDIDEGKVNMVITKDLSRLGRDYLQTGYYTDIYFARKRVRYIAVNDGIDTSRDDNDIAPFKNILNDMYAKDLSRKVKSAKRQRAHKGYFISAQPPYGYMVNQADKNQLVVDEEAAEVVKEIYRLAMAGKTLVQISELLTKREIITPSAYKTHNGDTRFSRLNKSTEWCYQTVRQILRDQVYVGDMVNHKYEVANYKTKERVPVPKEEHIVVKDTHEALVSRDDYERVQQIISQRHKPKKHHYDNVFQNLTFCSECGHRMTVMMKPLKCEGLVPVIRCMHQMCIRDRYHVTTRYYDPEVGRFVNGDGQLNPGINGNNMF